MEHTSQEILKQQVEEANHMVQVGSLYSHYKDANRFYEVLMIAVLEANDELCVVYQAQYDERLTFVRSLNSWLEPAEFSGEKVPRFTLKQ